MKENEEEKAVDRHITIPQRYIDLFNDYARAHMGSLSAFLVKAGIEKISRHKGEWLRRIRVIEETDIDHPSREEFESMTRSERWGYIERLRG